MYEKYQNVFGDKMDPKKTFHRQHIFTSYSEKKWEAFWQKLRQFCPNMDHISENMMEKRGKKGYQKYQNVFGDKMDPKKAFHRQNMLTSHSEKKKRTHFGKNYFNFGLK